MIYQRDLFSLSFRTILLSSLSTFLARGIFLVSSSLSSECSPLLLPLERRNRIVSCASHTEKEVRTVLPLFQWYSSSEVAVEGICDSFPYRCFLVRLRAASFPIPGTLSLLPSGAPSDPVMKIGSQLPRARQITLFSFGELFIFFPPRVLSLADFCYSSMSLYSAVGGMSPSLGASLRHQGFSFPRSLYGRRPTVFA